MAFASFPRPPQVLEKTAGAVGAKSRLGTGREAAAAAAAFAPRSRRPEPPSGQYFRARAASASRGREIPKAEAP